MDIFDLFAKLMLDSSEYEKGLGEAQKETGSFASKLKTGLSTAGKVGAAALGAVTTAAGFMTKKIQDGTNEIAAYGDNIDKASQKMGISAEAYQEWDAVLQHSGTSISSLGRGMVTLSRQAQKGSDAFQKLGISEEAVANMSQEDLFSAVIAGLQDMEEGTERTALAAELLGGSAKELGPLLNTSAEETENMKKRVRELGGVMSNDAVKAAAKYQDSLQDMQTALDGAKRGITSEFLPAVTSVMDGLTEVFSGNGEGGIGMISQGIGEFVDTLSEAMPRIMEFGTRVLLSLSDSIISNLPTLISAATRTVLTLADGLLAQLPTIIQVGLQVLVTLARGIAENLPTMIPTIVDVVLQIVDILTEPSTLATLVDASIAIILALANGLIEALPTLLEKAPEIVMNLVDAVIENAPKLWDAAKELIGKLAEGIEKVWETIKEKGSELIDKLWEGIKDCFAAIVGWGAEIWERIKEGFSSWWQKGVEIGKSLIDGIWQGLKSFSLSTLFPGVASIANQIVATTKQKLGIASPSKVFKEIGKFTIEGFAEGFDSFFPQVESDIAKKMGGLSALSVDLAGDLEKNRINGLSDNVAMEIQTPALTDAFERMIELMSDIREGMNIQLVLNDGVIAGRIDKLLGAAATRKARGNA